MKDASDTADTVLERRDDLSARSGRVPAGSTARPARESLSTALSATVDPVRVMADEEGRRSYRFALLAMGLCVLGLVLLPVFAAGNATARWGLMTCMATSAVYVFIVSVVRSDGSKYKLLRIGTGWTIHSITLAATALYFGVFSPVPLITVLAVHMAAQSSVIWIAGGVYAGAALWQALVAGLVIAGVIHDPGIVTAENLSTPAQIISQLVVEMVLLAAFVQGRMSRRSFHETLTEMDNAVRELAQRDALLEEARGELARALKVGTPGRYTGQKLGDYRLGVLIGRGGMGDVYEAFHAETDAVAAVKLISRRAHEPRAQKRFLRELSVTIALDSPHVVRVLALADEDDAMPYLVMERLRGEDLAHVLRIQRRLRPRAVAELVQQVGAGVSAAHALGVVHRDLKPTNIFRADTDAGPVWKVLDFGVSKLAEETSSLTAGEVVGTPAYMAPEQARGRPVDGRTDLYSLGVVAYRALTGHPAFTGNEIPAVLYDIVHSMPPDPSSLASLPAGADAVLAIALAKSPDDRFQTAQEMTRAFASVAAGDVSTDIEHRAAALLAKTPWKPVSLRRS